MSSTRVARLFQETRLNLDPAASNYVVDISLPAPRSLSLSTQASPKRRKVEKLERPQDEASFARDHIASESSIHFRSISQKKPQQKIPSSILWRILEDGTVLELQAVDLAPQHDEHREPALTLRFKMPNAIVPGSVAFTESQSDDQDHPLVVFVLTTRGELYTLKLASQAFAYSNFLLEGDQGPAGWCNFWNPSCLTYRAALRILVKDETEVWISLNDGSIVRLSATEGGAVTTWKETIISATSWKSSVRGLLAWRNSPTIRYRDVDFDSRSACSMAISPDGRQLWTICLDHAIRVWQVTDGKPLFEMDLNGDTDRDFQRPINDLIDPGYTCLLQLIRLKSTSKYTAVTYTPLLRQFKIWAVSATADSELVIQDEHPGAEIKLPAEDLFETPIYSLGSFHVHPKSGIWKMWFLVRCAGKHHTLTTEIDPRSPEVNLSQPWRWSRTVSDFSSAENLKEDLNSAPIYDRDEAKATPISASERWIAYITYPGRFSSSTLETALAVYRRSLTRSNRSLSSAHDNKVAPLTERILEAVASSAKFEISHSGNVNYGHHESSVVAQWQVFYGVVQDLQKQREQVLSLAYNEQMEQPWLCFADQISPLRQNCEVELLWHNRYYYANANESNHDELSNPAIQSLSDQSNISFGQLFYAAELFRKTLSKDFVDSFSNAVRTETTSISQGLHLNSPQNLYDISGFDGRVSDDDYDKLIDSLRPFGGIEKVTTAVILNALELLDQKPDGKAQHRDITKYGSRLLVKGAQESVDLAYGILVDLLLLVVFMVGELESKDLSKDFVPERAYRELIQMIRDHEILQWLLTTVSQPRNDSRENNSVEDSHMTITARSGDEVTLLHSLYLYRFCEMRTPQKLSQMQLLTYWCRAWCYNPKATQPYEQLVLDIMVEILKQGNLDIAMAFLRHMPNSPWAYYIRGRVYLAVDNIPEALAYFDKAAPDLGEYMKSTGNLTSPTFDAYRLTMNQPVEGFAVKNYDIRDLLNTEEKKLFNSGYARFYSHLVNLLDASWAQSYVAEYAKEALEHLDEEEKGHKQQHDTRLRTDLISRLFYASIRTSRYREAFDALVRHTDTALRDQAMATFLDRLLTRTSIPFLLSLPWSPNLAQSVDAKLEELCAKASTTSLFPPTSPLDPSHDSDDHPMEPHKVLYAFRINRGDYRGAALCLWERLQRLKALQRGEGVRGVDLDEAVMEGYLALINCLSLVDHEMAWLLVRPLAPRSRDAARGRKLTKTGESETGTDGWGDAAPRAKRRVITLDEIRREWQDEMDRVADVEAGRFALRAGDDADAEMDIDGAGDQQGAGHGLMPGSLGGGTTMASGVFAT